MKTSTMTKTLGVLALLGSSASMAATVSMGPDQIVSIGQNFTVTISGDVPNTFAGTMDLAFDPTKVAFVQSGTGVLAGVGIAPWIFIKNSPASATPTPINVEQPNTTGPNPGVYQIATLTFTALAAGNAGIIINDDGGVTSGWFDDTLFEYIPTSYDQANIQIVPVPAAAWLFVSALGGLAALKRRAV